MEYFRNGRNGRVGVQGHSGEHALGTDGLQGAVQVRRSFDVHGEHVGASGLEFLDVAFRLYNHQVNVQGLRSMAVDGLHNGQAER